MADEIIAALNRIELFHEFEVALKLSPEVTIHKKENIPANDSKTLFEYAVTDYDFSTQNILVNSSSESTNMKLFQL